MAFDRNNNEGDGLFALVDITGKGKGLLAIQDIEQGTLLVKDKAVLEIRHDVMLKEMVARKLWGVHNMIWSWLEVMLAVVIFLLIYQNWPIVAGCLVLLSWQRISSHIKTTQSFILFNLSWRDLVKQIKSLDSGSKDEFESLQNVFPFSNANQNWLGIFCTNSFQIGEFDRSGLFLKVSRLNHSCRANSDYNLLNGSIEVRTTRQVSAGEELTICYNNFLEEDGPVVKEERKNYLQWAYRFSCKCEDCSLTGDLSKINNHMRQRLVKLRKDWTLTQDFRQERQIVDEQIRLLLKLDSCGKMEYILQAVECGWEAEMDKREKDSNEEQEFEEKIYKDRATFLVQLGRKLSKTFYDLDHQKCIEWEERSQHL